MSVFPDERDAVVTDLGAEPTVIEGLTILRGGVQSTDQGWFKEGWHAGRLASLGIAGFTPVQLNVLHTNRRGVTRGFHAEPWNRIVSIVAGRALGAWVDLRPGPGFGTVATCELDADTAVFVPRGVANAHQILTEETTFLFLMDSNWTPSARELGAYVNLFDPVLGIEWPIGAAEAEVSERDLALPWLAETSLMPGFEVEPYRVLFVCTGNICRSPYAEVVAAASGMVGVEFASAGTHAVVGAGMEPSMEMLLPDGVDGSGHRARQLTRELAEETDLIVTLAAEHRRWVLDAWPGCGQKVFVIGQVAREMGGLPVGLGFGELAGHLWRHRSSAPGDDVPDPYRRGDAAAREAAGRIDGAVGAIVEGLRALKR